MKYYEVFLWLSQNKKINEYFDSKSQLGIKFMSMFNCSINVKDYVDSFCHQEKPITLETTYMTNLSSDFTLEIKDNVNLSYVIFEDNRTHEQFMIVIYKLPQYVLEMTMDYHYWRWETQNPGLILIPNLKNDKKLYYQFQFKKFLTLNPWEIKNYRLDRPKINYWHPSLTLKFYLDTKLPITVYDSNGSFVLGENLLNDTYKDVSDEIDINKDYLISCNDLISRKTQPIIRLFIGIYRNNQLMYSDYVIFRIAPALFTPNNLRAEQILVAKMNGIQNNHQFVKDVKTILDQEGFPITIMENKNISMFHRWVQDILKFVYCTDGVKTQYIVLKGPHYSRHSNKENNTSYMNDYFSQYPLYDFFNDTDKNQDAFGNIQVIPPILPQYPFGRIIYGISDEPGQPNISFNVVDFLESQQVQKPIRVNTGWLSVGHVDEVLSYVADPQSHNGLRILIASPNKFYELIKDLDKDVIIFDNKENFYLFDKINVQIQKRFTQKYENGSYKCVYNSQLTVGNFLSWKELISANKIYQKSIDKIKQTLKKELNLNDSNFFEIPIYYWPKSISPRARSIIPNMINNLRLDNFMLVPKPFGPIVNNNDLFENYFKEQIPNYIKVYFIRNWDCYYLLEGDINCGTNTKRKTFERNWWVKLPEGSYNI